MFRFLCGLAQYLIYVSSIFKFNWQSSEQLKIGVIVVYCFQEQSVSKLYYLSVLNMCLFWALFIGLPFSDIKLTQIFINIQKINSLPEGEF